MYSDMPDPASKEMEKARLETFGADWPYDSVKGYKATSKKVNRTLSLPLSLFI